MEHGGLDVTFIAGESLASYQFRFVHLENDTQVTLLDSASEFPFGILQNAPASGEAAVVRIEGTSNLVMNAARSVGDKIRAEYLSATDNGKGELAYSKDDLVRGIVIQASGAEDDVGAVLLTCAEYPVIGSVSPSASVSPSSSASASLSPSSSASASTSPSASRSPSASISPSSSSS
jgi:hypothetical protein